MILGVVGGYCAGKSTLTRYVQEQGWYVVDLDRLGHQALEVNADQVITQFGSEVAPDGKIDRKILGSMVFSDPKKLAALESIVHPWMIEQCKQQVHRPGNGVIDSALLFSLGLHNLCDAIVLVQTPNLIRLCRGMKRDGLSYKESRKRVKKTAEIIPKDVKNLKNLYIIRGGLSVIRRWKRIEAHVIGKKGGAHG